MVRGVAGPLAAVLGVAALLGVLVFLNEQPRAGGSPTVTAGRQTSAPPTTPPAAPSSSATTPAPTASVQAMKATATPTQPTRLPLAVLNDSRRHGLAAAAAAQFRARGWVVVNVGNYRGLVSETTVFYPAGGLTAARALAAQFPGIRQVIAGAGGPGAGLTVVVTRDYPA